MSNSKFIMAKKLCKVQQSLMGKTFEWKSLQKMLPIIFKECLNENMTFWFNFLEDAAVLNLRDIEHENYELNIRYAYSTIPTLAEHIEDVKINLLHNAFLISPGEIIFKINPPTIEVGKKDDDQQPIKMTNAVPPTSIRTVIDMLEKNGEPVTKKSIEKYLQLDKMSSDNRRRCIAYLRAMED